MSGVLEAAVAAARRSASERATRADWHLVERAAADARSATGGLGAAVALPGIRVIAECKRRSPSRGVLCRDYRPADIAAGYARAGAAAISVLTEPTFFDGALDHLRTVRAAVSVPVLRKDFIVSETQVIEARAAGADAVLLIVAALDDRTLRTLVRQAAAISLEALVEAHTGEEVRRAVDAGTRIVGVNCRDLRTLEVRIEVFDEVAGRLPAGVLAVAESGLKRGADARRLSGLGYRGFLVGEPFMTAPDPGLALAEFLTDAEGAPR